MSTTKKKTSSNKKKTTTKKSTTPKKESVNKVDESKEVVKNEDLIEETKEDVIEELTHDSHSVLFDAESDTKPKYVIKAPRIITNEDNKKTKKSKNKVQEEIPEIVRFNPTVKSGLTKEQVELRMAQGQGNVVTSSNTKTYRSIILGNTFTFFNLLCILVAVALIWFGHLGDCLFMIIVLANTLIGIIQEIKAKKTIEKISLVSSPTAMVVRDKITAQLPVNELVLDDIILLQTGKQICADSIILEGSVEVNESLLTGESVAIKKNKGDMLYSGSFVVGGKCYAKVERVGNDTYTAQLASKAKQYKKPKSELMGTLNMLIITIGVIIVPLSILMFLNNFGLSNQDLSLTIRRTATTIVGMIPSGMFLLTSMALAVGVIKLAKKRTLVQDLYSIEMLARADVLCLDKTGTITDGTMKVSKVIQVKPDLNYMFDNLVGSMLTALEDNNQTSRALITHFGYSKEHTAKYIMPFNSTRKMSGVTFSNGDSFIFGAPEYVLKTKHAEVDKIVKEYASKGFRVLLFAKVEGSLDGDKVPVSREPVAIVVIEDHIRDDAKDTIAWFKANGVDIKVISGDNPITVSEVSKRVGIEHAEKYISLEGLSQQQVIEAANKYTIFGRVSPEQKCILVKALKAKGHKVAMTGDGVNDILALKEADCSVAMASGSEATRLVSNLVLMDSNFSSMPSVVSEGRRVINNIQKSSSLFLMKTLFTMFLSIFCISVKMLMPFSTKQLMLLEYLVIGIPSFFLALQPNNEKINGKFLTNLLSKSLPSAIIIFINVVACYLFDITTGTDGEFVTMSSLVVTFVGLLVLLRICRPFDIFRGVMFTSMVTICALVLILPVGRNFLEYVPLSVQNILYIIVLVQASYLCFDLIVKGLDRLFNLKRDNR